MDLNRAAKFRVSRDFYRNAPDVVACVLSRLHFLPHRLEWLFIEDAIELAGCSPQFFPIHDDAQCPMVDVIISLTEDGDMAVRVALCNGNMNEGEVSLSSKSWRQFANWKGW